MQPDNTVAGTSRMKQDPSIGRIVSVTGAKAILLLDNTAPDYPD